MCVLDYVPFVYSRESTKGDYRVDIKGIIQALIIAAVTGLMVMYGAQKSIMVELDSIRKSIHEIKENQDDFRKDFYLPRRS